MVLIFGDVVGRILLDLSDDAIRRLDRLKLRRNLPCAELLPGTVKILAACAAW